MTEENQSDSYLLGSEESAFQRYRLFNEVYMPGTLHRLADLQIAPDGEVLEIGCGIGETACYFARHVVSDGHVTAFDQAPELVKLAEQRAAELHIENISFTCAKAQDFDYPTDRFDFAHTRYVLSYLSDAGEILRMIHAALKPSGLFLGEEIAQIYINHGRAGWYDQMGAWFSRLIELGGGDPNYGVSRLASDMLDAGFTDLQATAHWPLEDQQKVVDTLRIALSREMKQNLVGLGITTEEAVDDVVSELAMQTRDYRISASMAAQIIGRKP